MKIIIDTNRYRDFCAAVSEAVEKFRMAEEIYVPFIVLAELRAGFACGKLARKNEGVLEQFLNRSRVHVLFADEDTLYEYSKIYFQLRQQGMPIPTNDIWIASLATQHNLVLFSRDSHFDHLPQIRRL